jgi:hydroxyacylglutathione hydrolase
VIVSAHTVGLLQENCYLLVDEEARRCVLVDPGAEGERLVAAVRASGADLEAVWLTHAHIDHFGGLAAVKRAWDVPVYLHPADAPLWAVASRQAAAYGLPFEAPPPVDRALSDGETVRVGTLRFVVVHTPGHAPGHCIFEGHGIAFAGDLVFAGSVGRTDLPLSDPRAMQVSLERAATLPPETVLYPGHGPVTTMGAELRSNPFLTGAARVLGA